MRIHNIYRDLLSSITYLFDGILLDSNTIKKYEFNIGNRTFQIQYDTKFKLPAALINFVDGRPMLGIAPFAYKGLNVPNSNKLVALKNNTLDSELLLQTQYYEVGIDIIINCESQYQALEIQQRMINKLPLGKPLEIYQFVSYLEIDDIFLTELMFDVNNHDIDNLYSRFDYTTSKDTYSFAVTYTPRIKMDSCQSSIQTSSTHSWSVNSNFQFYLPWPILLEYETKQGSIYGSGIGPSTTFEESGAPYSIITSSTKDDLYPLPTMPFIAVDQSIELSTDQSTQKIGSNTGRLIANNLIIPCNNYEILYLDVNHSNEIIRIARPFSEITHFDELQEFDIISNILDRKISATGILNYNYQDYTISKLNILKKSSGLVTASIESDYINGILQKSELDELNNTITGRFIGTIEIDSIIEVDEIITIDYISVIQFQEFEVEDISSSIITNPIIVPEGSDDMAIDNTLRWTNSSQLEWIDDISEPKYIFRSLVNSNKVELQNIPLITGYTYNLSADIKSLPTDQNISFDPDQWKATGTNDFSLVTFGTPPYLSIPIFSAADIAYIDDITFIAGVTYKLTINYFKVGWMIHMWSLLWDYGDGWHQESYYVGSSGIWTTQSIIFTPSISTNNGKLGIKVVNCAIYINNLLTVLEVFDSESNTSISISDGATSNISSAFTTQDYSTLSVTKSSQQNTKHGKISIEYDNDILLFKNVELVKYKTLLFDHSQPKLCNITNNVRLLVNDFYPGALSIDPRKTKILKIQLKELANNFFININVSKDNILLDGNYRFSFNGTFKNATNDNINYIIHGVLDQQTNEWKPVLDIINGTASDYEITYFMIDLVFYEITKFTKHNIHDIIVNFVNDDYYISSNIEFSNKLNVIAINNKLKFDTNDIYNENDITTIIFKYDKITFTYDTWEMHINSKVYTEKQIELSNQTKDTIEFELSNELYNTFNISQMNPLILTFYKNV